MIRLLGILSLLFVSARAEDDPPDETVRKSIERDGVTLSVAMKKDAAVGGPYLVSLRVTNARTQSVGHDERGRYGVFEITVLDEDGNEVPRTRFGKRVLDVRHARGRTRIVKPGRWDGRLYNLARLFDLSETGSYRMTIRKKVFRRIKDLGEPVALEIQGVPVIVRNPSSGDWEKWQSAPRGDK